MNAHRLILIGCAWVAALAPATAFAEGWGLPNLNPFKRQNKSAAVRRSVSDDSGFNLPAPSMPKLPKLQMPKMQAPKLPKMQMPKMNFASQKKSSGPSTWQRMNNGARTMLVKTKNTLMPWTKPKTSGGARGSIRTARNTGQKKSGFVPSFFSKDEEARPVRSPADFLKQDRPLPY